MFQATVVALQVLRPQVVVKSFSVATRQWCVLGCHARHLGTASSSTGVVTTESPESERPAHVAASFETDSDDLPSHMLVTPSCTHSPEELMRLKKTAEFIQVVCESPKAQDALDMICAAMRLKTLQEKHLAAVQRRLRVLQLYWTGKQFTTDPRRILGIIGNNEELPVSTGAEVTERRRHRRVTLRPETIVSTKESPQRRMQRILELVLQEMYYCTAPSSDLVSKDCCVSAKVFNDFLLWMLDPYCRIVKQQRLQNTACDGDELHQTSAGELDLDESEEFAESEGTLLPPALAADTYTPQEVWQFVAQLELHGIPITTEVALDALALVLEAEDSGHRRSHTGAPIAHEIRKNRLEFIDRQRAAVRDSIVHARLEKKRLQTSGARRADAPHRAMKLSEVTPPPQEW